MPARRTPRTELVALLLAATLAAGLGAAQPAATVAATAPSSEALAPIAIDSGEYATCAIRADHTLWCWGRLFVENVFFFTNTDSIGQDGRNEPQQIGRDLWLTVSVGVENICGIVIPTAAATSGSLYCFGSNLYGQLGVNPSVLHDSSEPIRVGGDAVWKRVDVGLGTVCAMNIDDATYCVGRNDYNQFGLAGDNSNYSQLMLITTGEISSQIVVGAQHTCYLQADNGAAHCVGSNFSGQVGDGTLTSRDTFQTVTGGHSFSSLTAGSYFTCGIASSTTTPSTDAGKAFCWGNNLFGELGEGSPAGTDSSTPVLASSTLTFSALRAGDEHVCGITTAGRLYCWGQNWSGQVGVDPASSIAVSVPTQVGTGSNWVGLATGGHTSCGYTAATRTTAATTSCWGDRIAVGNGLNLYLNTPTKLPESGWLAVAIGGGSRCAIQGSALPGRLYCWGNNGSGEVGDGTTTARRTPYEVPSASGWSRVAMGSASTCAISGIGALWCWGRNYNGQLGLGDKTVHTAPEQVGSATDWSGVVIGDATACAIRANTSVWCWGSDSQGQVGNGDTTDDVTAPYEVISAASGHLWKKLSFGQEHVCALDTAGLLYCWGVNNFGPFGGGALGDGTYDSATAPVRSVRGLLFADVSAGSADTCGITVGGSTLCWGSNVFGALGNGNTVPEWFFCFMTCVGVDSATVSGANLSVVGGVWSACAIRRGGDLWCWGFSAFGSIPVGSDIASPNPTKVGSGFVSVALRPDYFGSSGGCGIKADTTLWCWGSTYGNLMRNGWPDTYSTPQAVKVLYRKPVAEGGAQITGLAKKSSVLTADAPSFTGTPLPAVTYQWYRCTKASTAQGSGVERGCTKITSATQSTYTLVTADVNKYVRLLITATNKGGTVTIFTSSTGKVAN